MVMATQPDVMDAVLTELGMVQDIKGRLWVRCCRCGGDFLALGLRQALDGGACPECRKLDLARLRTLIINEVGGQVCRA